MTTERHLLSKLREIAQQWRPCVRRKQLRFCPWMTKQQGGREIAVRGCFSNSWSQEKCLRETQNRQEPVREEKQTKSWVSGIACVSEVNRGGVCMWVRTDSPATPLPQQLTSSTTSCNYLMRVVGRRHMGFSSQCQSLTISPTLILVKIMPLSI